MKKRTIVVLASLSFVAPFIFADNSRTVDPLIIFHRVISGTMPKKYVNCGQAKTDMLAPPPGHETEQQRAATRAEECAAAAFTAKKAFVIQRDIAGVDSLGIHMLVGNARGQVFAFSYDSNICGASNDTVVGCGPSLAMHPCRPFIQGESPRRRVSCERE